MSALKFDKTPEDFTIDWNKLEETCVVCKGERTVDGMVWDFDPALQHLGKVTCRNCNGIGKVLTPFGLRFFEFMKRHAIVHMLHEYQRPVQYQPLAGLNQVEISDVDVSDAADDQGRGEDSVRPVYNESQG